MTEPVPGTIETPGEATYGWAWQSTVQGQTRDWQAIWLVGSQRLHVYARPSGQRCWIALPSPGQRPADLGAPTLAAARERVALILTRTHLLDP